MPIRRVPLTKEDISSLQEGSFVMIGLIDLGPIVTGILMIQFEAFDSTFINALPIVPGIFIIGFAVSLYLKLKRDVNYGSKEIVSGSVQMLRIRYPSKYALGKVTYEILPDNKVRITEEGLNKKEISTFTTTSDYFLKQKPYRFYVTLESREYEIPPLDFLALRKNDPLELEVLPLSGNVLKVNGELKN